MDLTFITISRFDTMNGVKKCDGCTVKTTPLLETNASICVSAGKYNVARTE